MQASPDALVHHARLLGAMATNWIGALLCIAPSAQFGHWLFRTLANTQLHEPAVVHALAFIAKLRQRHPTMRFPAGFEYRLAVAAFMLANKALDDATYTLTTWAQVTKLPPAEIRAAEAMLFIQLDMDASLKTDEFFAWRAYFAQLPLLTPPASPSSTPTTSFASLSPVVKASNPYLTPRASPIQRRRDSVEMRRTRQSSSSPYARPGFSSSGRPQSASFYIGPPAVPIAA